MNFTRVLSNYKCPKDILKPYKCVKTYILRNVTVNILHIISTFINYFFLVFLKLKYLSKAACFCYGIILTLICLPVHYCDLPPHSLCRH